MARRTKRLTLATGIYRDGNSLEVRVMVNGTQYTKRIPPDLTVKEAIAERKRLLARAETENPAPSRHTLAFDIPRYLRLFTHQASYKNKRAILNHWKDRLGHLGRHRITAQDVQLARADWLQANIAPKTINHRVNVLRHLYVTLDGKQSKTPCDGIAELHVPKTPIRRVSDETILKVDAELQRREADPRCTLRSPKTRARFRVLVSTGRRPSEIMRAEPGDVDLQNRVWVVRDGKGGWSPGLYLNDDMLAAWTFFIQAKAWGQYNTGSFAEALREAGWPADVRVYNARHSTWIAATERGADMADVQVGAGHKHLATTRIYTGIRRGRMQRLSELLEGRFQGFPVAGDSGDSRNS